MKRLINKLVGWLNAIAKDKYQHFAVGAVIASAALIVAVPLVAAFAGVDDRRLDGRHFKGAQDRPESRHAGHSMDARRRRYGVAGNLGCYYFWIKIPQVTTIINRDRG